MIISILEYLLGYHVKIYSIFAVVMIAFCFSLVSMERPPFRSPIKRPSRSLPCEQLRTPKGEPVRVALFRTVNDMVEGHDESECDPGVLSPHLMEASPLSYFKGVKNFYDCRFDNELQKYGVPPSLIKELMPEARLVLQEECRKVVAGPVKSPLRRCMAEVARLMKVSTPEFKSTRLDNPGYCMGNLVLVDENCLQEEAHTPGGVKVVLAHELCHRENEDMVKHYALSMACDVAGVTLPPEFLNKRCRFDEAMADCGMAATDPALAQASARMTREAHHIYGDEQSESHGSRRKRRVLSELNCELHKENVKRKRVNRDLKKEFEAVWDDGDKQEVAARPIGNRDLFRKK